MTLNADRRRLMNRALLAASLPVWPFPGGNAVAQTGSYPNKPVKIVVGSPPGGPSDFLARIMADGLGAQFGQSFVIENRPGASGMPAADAVAKSAPDGHTLLASGPASIAVTPHLYPRIAYDSLKDFVPVSLLGAGAFVLVAHPSLNVRNVAELIEAAKARPDGIAYGSGGNGSSGHLCTELFANLTGTKMLHVPYKGASPATLAVLTGEVSMTITTTTSVLPQAKAGRLRILGATTLTRIPQLPEVPTVAESGLPGYEAISWFALVAPAAINPDLLRKIVADAQKVVKTRDMQEKLAVHGAVLTGDTPEQLRTRIRDDLAKWARIIQQAGVKAE